MSNPTLKDELKLLRSALIGMVGKDAEGDYKPIFVREMFADLKRKPTLTFKSGKDFLKEIN